MVILDSGHGGLVEGKYTTAGKRAYWNEFTINEGVLNRAVVNLLAFKLDAHNIPCHIINPENHDTRLGTRVSKANQLAKKYDCIYISVHHNAGRGTGCEVFTSIGSTDSDDIAKALEDEFVNIPLKWRGCKERNFYVLRSTRCPAVLTEFSFMDTFDDAHYMMNGGIEDEAEWIFNAIRTYFYKHKIQTL